MDTTRFDCELYNESDRGEWERFIRKAPRGTIFHHQRFLEYHPPERFQHAHLIFRRKGHIVAVWPGAFRQEEGKKTWVSHPGASYGGLVVREDVGILDVHSIVAQLILKAAEMGMERLRCTIPPMIYSRRPSDLVEFTLLRAGFRYLKQDYTQAVDLNALPAGEENIIRTYNAKSRTAVRSARRHGVVIHHSVPVAGETLSAFYEILESNRERLGVIPTHTEEELARLATLAPGHLDLSLAYLEDQPIAGILNFICNESVLLEFYIAHRLDYQGYRPVPLLVHESILIAKGRGFRWFDFGISTEAGGKVTWGLAAFKENFGVQAFFRNMLVLENVQDWRPEEDYLPES